MFSFQDFGRIYSSPTTGQAHTQESMNIIEATWYDDPASTVAYFYDYYHDDEPEKNIGLHPEQSKTKTRIDIKYMLSAYKTLEKDEQDIHIMFKPSYKCNVSYYKKDFIDVISSRFPTGLYCDIYDKADHMWKRWLVVAEANVNNQDFPNWAILPCTYKFQWVYEGKKYEMWGVERSQSS